MKDISRMRNPVGPISREGFRDRDCFPPRGREKTVASRMTPVSVRSFSNVGARAVLV